MKSTPPAPTGPANWSAPRRPDIGGTRAPGPDTYANGVLKEHGAFLAREATRLFYVYWPSLHARYGERGREHALEDCYWHLAHVDAAQRQGSPKLFLDYVGWLRAFLQARGLGDALVGANFTFLRDLVRALELPEEQEEDRTRVLELLDAALAQFPPEALELPALRSH